MHAPILVWWQYREQQQHVGIRSMYICISYSVPIPTHTYVTMLRRGKMVLLLLTPICCINKKLMSVDSVLGNRYMCLHMRLANTRILPVLIP